MTGVKQLVEYCDELLDAALYRDYCPNGLQVEGAGEVQRIVSGVTACQALVDAAVERGADLLLVHHGYFWKGEAPTLVGMKRRRIKALLDNDINLLAYHLPLDGHPQLGNNAQLGARLGFEVSDHFLDNDIGCLGRLDAPCSLAALGARVDELLGRTPQLIAGGDHPIERIAWCSGAAQGYLEQAAALGADAYLSGEISEHTVHAARELGIHYIAAGHHATERFGVQALGTHLAAHFDIYHEYIDIPNPV